MNPTPSKKPKLHSRVVVERIAVPIYSVAAEFLVRYRDGQQRFGRTFERLDQAQVFARFLAHRQHWHVAALEFGVRQRTPVVPGFIVGPATTNPEAVEQFLSACVQMNTSATTLRTMADLLRNALPAAPTVEALTVAWAGRATSPAGSTSAHRAVRRAIVGRFLGWLARQPIEAPTPCAADSDDELLHLTITEAETLLRACPDLDTRRFLVWSLFVGLRPHEVESLHWEDFQKALSAHGAKTLDSRLAPIMTNLIKWLQVPEPASGPVVTKAARRKVKALLHKLNLRVNLHALRTSCLLFTLALFANDSMAAVGHELAPIGLRAPVSQAEAERFFSLTPD